MKTHIVYRAENERDERNLAAMWNHAPLGMTVTLQEESKRKDAKRGANFIRSHVKQIKVRYR